MISELIDRKLTNEQSLLKEFKIKSSYEEHIAVYLHCLTYLGLDDPYLKKKKVLWGKYILARGNLKSKYYDKLIAYKKKEEEIIIMALDKIENIKGSDSSPINKLYKEYTWAILAYEHESSD